MPETKLHTHFFERCQKAHDHPFAQAQGFLSVQGNSKEECAQNCVNDHVYSRKISEKRRLADLLDSYLTD
jgi:hypothetical protein